MNNIDNIDTIFALATVFGKSGVAVFRISGPQSYKIKELFNLKRNFPHREAVFTKLYDCPTYCPNYEALDAPDNLNNNSNNNYRFDNKEGANLTKSLTENLTRNIVLIDEVIILHFKAPNSFTGENIYEIHCHGSIAVIKYITDKLSSVFRLAEAGEFTKRAFLNNKFDLTKAEGIIDLINAETKEQIKQTSLQLSGELAKEYNRLRALIIKAWAKIEAYIDFPEEELPLELIAEIKEEISLIIAIIKDFLNDSKFREKIREGFKLAIIGAPNTGKSTLLNYFAKKDLAIVTNIPGTTRDALEFKADIRGYPVTFIDTAGLRETKNIIEKIGIAKAKAIAKEADILIIMSEMPKLTAKGAIEEANKGSYDNDININNIKALIKEITLPLQAEVNNNIADNYNPSNFSSLPDINNNINNIIYVASKADLLADDISFLQPELALKKQDFLLISVHKKFGLKELEEKIWQILSSNYREASIITNSRQRQALEKASLYLKRFNLEGPIELAAEDLRIAASYIGSVTGEIKVDDILDQLFSSFCIGK